MTQSSLRPARESDLQALHEIERACFGSQGWSEESLRALLQNPLSDVLVLESDGRACGYAGIRCGFYAAPREDAILLPRYFD